MSSAGVDAILFEESFSSPIVRPKQAYERPMLMERGRFEAGTGVSQSRGPRRTPRKSLIVVLAENHVVSADMVADRLPAEGDDEIVDVILACAGEPLGIASLQRRVRDLQILLAPAGTTTEDLRELAMSQAPGDIVTLLSGTPVLA
jgi:hypothetical protein